MAVYFAPGELQGVKMRATAVEEVVKSLGKKKRTARYSMIKIFINFEVCLYAL